MKKVKKAIIQLLGIERSTGDIGILRRRSYNAKYSEYYWILETKIDISGGYDIHANRIIQVI
jgi:hypothetical protein